MANKNIKQKDTSILGKNLKSIRKFQKMTQKELSEKSGVKQSVISDLETGIAQSTGSIIELASALGVSAEELKTQSSHNFDNEIPPISKCCCGNTKFKCVTQSIDNCDFLIDFIQCTSCSTVIGILEHSNHKAQLQKIETRLQIIEHKLKI